MRDVFHRARDLRRRMTEAEAKLWRRLRGRQLAGLKFRRQFPIAGFIADFACPEAGLVVELDGGQHADAVEYDRLRSERLAGEGYRVLRFWNDDALRNTEAVLEAILRHVATPPQPSPASRGGGPLQEPREP